MTNVIRSDKIKLAYKKIKPIVKRLSPNNLFTRTKSMSKKLDVV